jgi:Ca2+-binding RTX toxin-like protein
MTGEIRIKKINADDAYVIVGNSDYGAIAYHFQRNMGGTSSADSGAPYDVWRRTGEFGLASINADPTGPRVLIGSDVGSFDYAFYSIPSATWGGSYHGAERLTSISGSSLAADSRLDSFSISQSSIITYKAGETIKLNTTLSINAVDGSYTEAIKATSSSRFSQQIVGMEIGSGIGWTQVSIDNGMHWLNIGSSPDYELGEAGNISMRNSLTGQTISVASDANQQSAFFHSHIVRTDYRAKLYYNFDGVTMDTISATRNVSFGHTSAGQSIDVLSSETYKLVALDTNLTLTGTLAINGMGNASANSLVGNTSANKLEGLGGDDRLYGYGGADTLFGGDGDDLLDGGSGADLLDGGAGDDVLQGGMGADILIGGTGVNTASYADAQTGVHVELAAARYNTGEAAGDTFSQIQNIKGSLFNDVLVGDNASNFLSGGDGNDVLDGAAGNDTLDGTAGSDTLIGGSGGDKLVGGDGFDFASYETAATSVRVELLNSARGFGDAAGDTFTSIEGLIGSNHADTLIGDNSENRIYGGSGDDLLGGMAGDDKLYGGAGNDQLYGSDGNDWMDGGSGADLFNGGGGINTVSYQSATSGVKADLANAASNTGDAAGDTYLGVQRIWGSEFADYLSGDAAANELNGAAGDDYLFGGKKDDVLIGGAGNDMLVGGENNDTFVFEAKFGADTIADFQAGPGAGDVIRLLLGTAFDSFAEVMAVASRVGDGTIFNFGDGNTILTQHVLPETFSANDVIFA